HLLARPHPGGNLHADFFFCGLDPAASAVFANFLGKPSGAVAVGADLIRRNAPMIDADSAPPETKSAGGRLGVGRRPPAAAITADDFAPNRKFLVGPEEGLLQA